ncbi:MAG: carbohydrate kinase, thermoresistant glucokinase family [Gemmatimonadetes bacterium]|nr:carbohydrate kinase, thermoresistant glucokinase family [Gemmatimonadota bacterium]
MSESGGEGRTQPAHQGPRAHADGQARVRVVIVMGVAGAGKTTVGRALAARLGWPFHDADHFHSPANVAKMSAGIPLTDADRAPWLAALRERIAVHLADGTRAVVACSALRESYRAALLPARATAAEVAFVQLDVSPALAKRRLATRQGHFMRPDLVASQFAALEAPHVALRLDASRPVQELVVRIIDALGGGGAPGA